MGDVAELKAIAEVFGDHAPSININSTKSMTGHLLGAAGAIEAIASILAMKHGIVPPTINLDDPDPEGKALSIAGPVGQPAEGLVRISPDAQTLLLTVDAETQMGRRRIPNEEIAEAAMENPDIEWVVPEEGLSLWSDNMLVPNKAEHKTNAEALMNHYYQPEIAAELAAWVW